MRINLVIALAFACLAGLLTWFTQKDLQVDLSDPSNYSTLQRQILIRLPDDIVKAYGEAELDLANEKIDALAVEKGVRVNTETRLQMIRNLYWDMYDKALWRAMPHPRIYAATAFLVTLLIVSATLHFISKPRRPRPRIAIVR